MNNKEIREERFTSQPGELIIMLPAVLKAEFEKNLQEMEHGNLDNEQFLQLSERNIEIQRMLFNNDN